MKGREEELAQNDKSAFNMQNKSEKAISKYHSTKLNHTRKARN